MPESLARGAAGRLSARLLVAYGPQGWWPGSGDPFEIVVGAVLTQAVSWKNVELALANLRRAGALTAPAVHALDDATLAALIRPSGYHTVKARRLRAIVRLIVEEQGGDLGRLLALPLGELRPRLLGTYGIGEETADDILVYAGSAQLRRRRLRRAPLHPSRPGPRPGHATGTGKPTSWPTCRRMRPSSTSTTP